MTARSRIADNPFYILGLAPDCTRMEFEREGHKLLSMLELRLSAARTYSTPFGSIERTPELVREAMAELRDPQKRLGHELWARLGAATPTTHRDESRTAGKPWTDALAVLGWRPR